MISIQPQADERGKNSTCVEVESVQTEHGVMPDLTHWVNLLLPGGDP